jgi:hypothetical protein
MFGKAHRTIIFNFRLAKICFFAALLMVFAASCTQKFYPDNPVPGQFHAPPEPVESVVEIPVAIDINKLRTFINKQVPKELYKGRERGAEQAEFGDGLLRVHKEYVWEADFVVLRNGDVKLDVLKDGSFRFKIPLKIRCEGCASVNLGLGFTLRKCGYSNPEIDLYVTTAFKLNADWSLSSKSKLAYDLRNAKLSIPFDLAGFPVFTYTMDIKEDLQEPMDKELKAYAEEIDKQIAAEFKALNVKKMVEDVWKEAFVPQKVSDDPPVWVQMQPRKVFMGEFSQRGGKLILPVGLGALIDVRSSPTEAKPTPVPKLSPAEQPGNIKLNIPVSLDYKLLADAVKAEVKDCTFTQGKHAVTIRDVAMRGAGNAVWIDVTIQAKSGKLFKKVEGHVHLMAVPAYDKKFRRLYLEHFTISSETNKMLIDKNLSWLAEKVFYDKIIKEAKYNIGPEVETQRNYINDYLKDIRYDMLKASGKIDKIELEGIHIQPETLTIYFQATGSIASEVVLQD